MRFCDQLFVTISVRRQALKFFTHFIVFICCLLMASSFLTSCEKKKQEAKLIIAEQEFSLNKDTDRTFIIDCKGKIKNVGDGFRSKCVMIPLAEIFLAKNLDANKTKGNSK